MQVAAVSSNSRTAPAYLVGDALIREPLPHRQLGLRGVNSSAFVLRVTAQACPVWLSRSDDNSSYKCIS